MPPAGITVINASGNTPVATAPIVSGGIATNNLGIGSNVFGISSNTFGVGSNIFGVASNDFGIGSYGIIKRYVDDLFYRTIKT